MGLTLFRSSAVRYLEPKKRNQNYFLPRWHFRLRSTPLSVRATKSRRYKLDNLEENNCNDCLRSITRQTDADGISRLLVLSAEPRPLETEHVFQPRGDLHEA